MAATLSADALVRLKKVMLGMNPGGTTGDPATLGSPTDRDPTPLGLMGKKLKLLSYRIAE